MHILGQAAISCSSMSPSVVVGDVVRPGSAGDLTRPPTHLFGSHPVGLLSSSSEGLHGAEPESVRVPLPAAGSR